MGKREGSDGKEKILSGGGVGGQERQNQARKCKTENIRGNQNVPLGNTNIEPKGNERRQKKNPFVAKRPSSRITSVQTVFRNSPGGGSKSGRAPSRSRTQRHWIGPKADKSNRKEEQKGENARGREKDLSRGKSDIKGGARSTRYGKRTGKNLQKFFPNEVRTTREN